MWQVPAAAESCENTFVMATRGIKSLKPKNNNTHKRERQEEPNKRTEQKRKRKPMQGKPHYQNEFMHISKREQTNNTER